MKQFIHNPFSWLLSLFNKEVRPASPILMHMVSTTHNTWIKRMQDNGSIKNYEYSIFTK